LHLAIRQGSRKPLMFLAYRSNSIRRPQILVNFALDTKAFSVETPQRSSHEC
jgi:hypothetical protein